MSFSQEHPHPQSLKRDHDQFLLEDIGEVSRPFTIDPKYQDVYQSPSRDETGKSKMENGAMSLPTPPTSIGTSKRGPSPARSSTGSLTDPRSATPSLPANSPDPKNSTVFRGPSAPPPKKAKLTLVEKEVMRINKEIKDQERSAEKARKESERLAHAQEKARKDAEKEAEKKKKEAEREEKKALQEAEKAVKEERRRKKEEEKQQKEQEKQQKEEEKRQKEEEKQRAEEEKRKKDRNQKKLNSYFVQRNSGADRTSMSPAPSNALLGPAIASPAAPSPRKSETSHYEQFFPTFFIQTNVTVAPINRFERDEDTSENQQRMLDSYIQQNRSPGHQLSFDAVSLFNLPRRTVRGRQCMTVREIMAEMSTGASCHIDLTTDSQDCQIKSTEDLLRSTPLKFLKFAEDVRPPYQGTYTSRPLHGMAKLARNPLRRDLPDTNYDYDSEAEWIEDEDAEDLHSEGEEDDAELDDAEDMDGFLDDENDELLTSKRLVLQGDLEPISTGLCWEDQPGKNINPRMMEYRMEAIHDQSLRSIDPLSSHYWEPVTAKVKPMDPPRLPLNTLKSNSLCSNGSSSTAPNTNKPVKPFFGPASAYSKFSIQPPASGTPAVASKGKEKKLLPREDWGSFKEEVHGSNLSKVGLIEVLKKKFPKATGGMVKATLEVVAQRVGKKESEKRWIVSEDAGGMSTTAT